MEFIKTEDYNYIRNKYHDASKPYDSFNRFVRNDSIFSADSGMDPEAIMDALDDMGIMAEQLILQSSPYDR